MDKLGDDPIKKMFVSIKNSSSVALNELLAVIFHNSPEEGFEEIWFSRFPKNCEIDNNLLAQIAYKSPNLKKLSLSNLNLLPQEM